MKIIAFAKHVLFNAV